VAGEKPKQARQPSPPDRLVGLAVAWTVAVVAGLLLWLLSTGPKLVGGAILLAPLVGVLIAFLRPRSVLALVAACLFISVAALLLLIGLTGFLFLPSLALLLAALVRELRRRRTERPQSART
jgi:predicted branched-subunit amino acid permease